MSSGTRSPPSAVLVLGTSGNRDGDNRDRGDGCNRRTANYSDAAASGGSRRTAEIPREIRSRKMANFFFPGAPSVKAQPPSTAGRSQNIPFGSYYRVQTLKQARAPSLKKKINNNLKEKNKPVSYYFDCATRTPGIPVILYFIMQIGISIIASISILRRSLAREINPEYNAYDVKYYVFTTASACCRSD